MIGDTGLAFMDFQKLIVIEPVSLYLIRSNTLIISEKPYGAHLCWQLVDDHRIFEDATKAFTNADNIHKSSLALYQRARCNVALNNMGEALKDLNKVLETANSDKVAIADRECLNALKVSSGGTG